MGWSLGVGRAFTSEDTLKKNCAFYLSQFPWQIRCLLFANDCHSKSLINCNDIFMCRCLETVHVFCPCNERCQSSVGMKTWKCILSMTTFEEGESQSPCVITFLYLETFSRKLIPIGSWGYSRPIEFDSYNTGYSQAQFHHDRFIFRICCRWSFIIQFYLPGNLFDLEKIIFLRSTQLWGQFILVSKWPKLFPQR